MRKGSAANNNKKILSDIERIDDYEIEDEVFFEGDIPNLGTPIAIFNFGNNLNQESDNLPTPEKSIQVKQEHDSTPVNKISPAEAARGLTPPIDGEYFTLKRGYQFRPSTLRKLNELRAKHPDINVYLNTILDAAILHYHDYIINNDGDCHQEDKKKS
jgi:hypothetical protein